MILKTSFVGKGILSSKSQLLFRSPQLIFKLFTNIPLTINYLSQIFLLVFGLIQILKAIHLVDPMGLFNLACLNLPLHLRTN